MNGQPPPTAAGSRDFLVKSLRCNLSRAAAHRDAGRFGPTESLCGPACRGYAHHMSVVAYCRRLLVARAVKTRTGCAST